MGPGEHLPVSHPLSEGTETDKWKTDNTVNILRDSLSTRFGPSEFDFATTAAAALLLFGVLVVSEYENVAQVLQSLYSIARHDQLTIANPYRMRGRGLQLGPSPS